MAKVTKATKGKTIKATKARNKKLATQKADNEKAKARALKASKAASTQGFKTLAPMAKEINAKLDRAAVAEGKAFDHRLSACCMLAEAKEVAEKAKINWKKWCENNVTQSPETIRKLVMVGKADDPKLALEDLRLKNARQMAASRAAAKARASMTPVSGKATSAAPSDDAPRPPAETPAGKILSGLDSIDKQQGRNLLKSKAGEFGLKAVTQSDIDAEIAKAVRKAAPKTKETKALFLAMDAADKMEFLRWAADQMDAKLITGFEVSDDDPLAIPAAMKRNAA
jgi:hypothetical protein